MESGFITLLVGFVSQKYGLSGMNTLYISKIIESIVAQKDTVMNYDWTHWITFSWWYMVIPLSIIMYKLYYYILERNSYIIKIYDAHTIGNMYGYFERYPECIEINSVDIGSIHTITSDGLKSTIPSAPTNFWIEDAKVGRVYGKIHNVFVLAERSVDLYAPGGGSVVDIKTEKKYRPCVEIKIESAKIPACKFSAAIARKLMEYDNMGRFEEVIISGSQMRTYNPVEWMADIIFRCKRVNYDPDIFVKDYFYNDRDHLFDSIRSALDRGDQWNAILHGPGGTGKTFLATTLAKILERDIYSVDLRYLTRGETLKTFFGTVTYRRKIFVLEEFDNVVRYLKHREQEDAETFEVIDGKPIKRPINPDVLKLSDLLEILQGPIPRPGLIIIATTNDFTYIKESLPNLVRPGRMTPWYIGYTNNTIYHEIIHRYFPDVTDITLTLPEDHSIPTVQILDYAKSSSGDYQKFSKLMIKLIN